MGQTVGVQLLGPTALIVDGQFVELGSIRQRRLLAALALDAGMVVSADRLADRVWADGELPDDPRRALRTNLARLRQAIGDVEVIATEPTGWRLDDAQVELDTRCFDELVSAAAEPGIDVHGRLARLDEALALWRGGAYEDMAGEDWVRAESTRLEELKLTAVERRYDAMLAAGMHTDALPGLAGEVDANPLRDRLVGLQMLALYRSGRQAEATRVYEQHRRHLADELGLEPGAKLHELDSRIVAGDPSLHITSTAGTPLRSYRLGEQLGEGAFAVVYRGTQPSVGRDVAVKVIRADLANRPEFVRRFEAEAHLVARLEHPYIVPLYDYWREPDRACLVLRYLRGGTLEARLTSSGPLSLDACATMVEQIGSALATAHAEGVVHRDVKPANVFLDEVGNFYLGDFGIALEATEVSDPTAALSAGSPAYASPEQLRREPVGPPADVHGLAISIYESLTGRLPFPAAASQAELLQHQLHDPIPDVRERRGEVPAAVDAVIQRATAKRPGDRYQTVEELMAEFEAALQADQVSAVVKPGSATVITTAEARNPYKGLRAFTEADSGDFHGRERLVDRLLALMSQTGTTGRIAAVVGPSGIGKSSVVRAGLLPALRRGQVPTSERWFVATMLPGSNPFDEMAAALLRVATHAPDNMMGMLTDDRRGIARVVKALVPDDDGSDVLLVIDQFEELFTLTAQADTVRFLDALEHAVTDTRCPLRVVLTMRADFWDRPLRHGAFARLIDASTVNVTALAPDELERAIVAPAHHFGVEFEPGLVSEIVADVNDQPGALPLLQYALTELWDHQVAGVLTRDAYRELGGVTGALARRAEDLYVESTTDEQHAARRLFGRLVTLGEGTEDVRRRAVRNEVGDDDATTSVIDRFGQARLFSFDHDPTTREPTIEVAHEALIREWPRLRSWLDDDRDSLRVHRHLTDSAAAWLASDRELGELYRGARLESAEMWTEGHPTDLNVAEREFLNDSVSQRNAEEAAERKHLDQQARSNRRLRVLVGVATVIAVIAAVAGVFALQQQSRAEDTAFAGETARLAATAQALADTNPRAAMLLAVAAHQRQETPATLGALQAVLASAGPLVGHLAWGTDYIDVEWLVNDRIVGVRTDGLDLFDTATGQMLDSVEIDIGNGPTPFADNVRVGAAASAPVVVVASGSSGLVYDVGDQFAIRDQRSLGNALWSVAVNSDGTMFLAADDANLVTAWTDDGTRFELDLDDSADIFEQASAVLGPDFPFGELFVGFPVATRFVPFDGFFLAMTGSSIRRIDWEGVVEDGPTYVANEFQPGTLIPAGPLTAVDDLVDPVIATDEEAAGLTIVTTNGLLRMPIEDRWPDLATASPVEGTRGGGTPDLMDGGRVPRDLVVVLNDGSVRSINSVTGATIALVDVGLEGATAFANRDGRVVVAHRRGLTIVSVGGAGPIAESLPRDQRSSNLSISRGGRFAVMGPPGAFAPITVYRNDADGGWSPVDGLPTEGFFAQAPPDPVDVLLISRLSPEDSEEQLTYTLETSAPELLAIDVEQRPGATSGDLSPNLTISAIGTVPIAILEFPSFEAIAELEPPPGLAERTGLTGVKFNTAGTRLLISEPQGRSQLYDANSWDLIDDDILADHDIAVGFWNADDSLIATASSNGRISIRDGETFEVIRTMFGAVGTSNTWNEGALLFTVDDRFLLTNFDGPGRLWDVATGQQIGIDFPNVAGNSGVNYGDHVQLITSTEAGALVWNLDVEQWPEIACRSAGSNLTTEEWAQWGPRDEEARAICPEFPAPG